MIIIINIIVMIIIIITCSCSSSVTSVSHSLSDTSGTGELITSGVFGFSITCSGADVFWWPGKRLATPPAEKKNR